MIKIGSLCHSEKQPCSKIDLRSHASPTVYNVGHARLSGPHCLCLCNGNSKAYLKCQERPGGQCKKSNGNQNCNRTEAERRRRLCFFPLYLGSSESSHLQLCICSLYLVTLDYVKKDITTISQCYQLTYYLFITKFLDLVRHDTTKRKCPIPGLLSQAETKE